MARATLLVVPGFAGSPPEHWQSHLHATQPGARRVVQDNWQQPTPADWVGGLDRAVAASPGPVVLVAHSLGCITTALWAAQAADNTRGIVRGALLVAPVDVDSADRVPDVIRSFAPIPRQSLPFPSLLVASRSDPYCGFDRAAAMAMAWGSDLLDLGAAGHINVDAGYGPWPAVAGMLEDFDDRARALQTVAGAR